MTNAITVTDLSLNIGGAPILSGVNLALRAGKVTALIGRSGSGKSMTALAMMGLAPRSAQLEGEIIIDGDNDILAMNEKTLCGLRGSAIGMIFQEPMTALNPLQPIGAQVAETFIIHQKISRAEALEKAKATLARVGLPEESIPSSRYPHELSGGQRQRVVIAIAIALKPKILIADEPTTALDVTTQAEILSLLKGLAREDGSALLLITHDLAAVSNIADHILIMKGGRIVADKPADAFYADAANDSVKEFVPARIMRPEKPYKATDAAIIAESVSCDYNTPRQSFFHKPRKIRAVESAAFAIAQGENLGLVGESGCGKSTLAKALLGLHAIADGAISIGGEAFPAPQKSTMRRLRQKIQIVFQDPFSSFNPRKRVAEIVSEPLHLFDTPLSKADKYAH
ncbi:MAG: ATP-binding cassette domain-containing protein, partial [Pseudomonadota bacterium]